MAELSPRARQAVVRAALALVVIGATSVYYLRPWGVPEPSAQPSAYRAFPVQRAGDAVGYQFVSSTRGWAALAPQPRGEQAGLFSIFKTEDAGKHWRRQLSGHSLLTFTTLLTFRFVDVNRGFLAAGDPLALYRTNDGGEHWTTLELPTQDAVTFQFTDALHLWLFARPRGDPQGVFHPYASSDGGETWTRRPDLPADPYFYPTFRNGSEGWSGSADRASPHVFVTVDGGTTWQRRDLPRDEDPPQPVATSVRLLPQAGVVAYRFPPDKGIQLEQRQSYTSFDGGRSWHAITSATPNGDLGNYAFQDPTQWWSVQERALYKTTDAGRTWTVAEAAPDGLLLLRVFDDSHAWAQLEEGFGTELVLTADAGLHWTRTNVPISQ